QRHWAVPVTWLPSGKLISKLKELPIARTNGIRRQKPRSLMSKIEARKPCQADPKSLILIDGRSPRNLGYRRSSAPVTAGRGGKSAELPGTATLIGVEGSMKAKR